MDISNNLALQEAVTISVNSAYLGGNWGFLLSNHKDYNEIRKILASEKSIKVQTLSNGILVKTPYEVIVSVMKQVNEYSPEVDENIRNRVNNETKEFQNMLKEFLNNRSKYQKTDENGSEITFALYSCNMSHKIRANGIEYPAFALTVEETIKHMAQLTKFVKLYISTDRGYIDFVDIVKNKDIGTIMRGTEIAGTHTGAFVSLRIEKK